MGRPVRMLLHPDEMMRSELRQGQRRQRRGDGIFRLSGMDEVEGGEGSEDNSQTSELGSWVNGGIVT